MNLGFKWVCIDLPTVFHVVPWVTHVTYTSEWTGPSQKQSLTMEGARPVPAWGAGSQDHKSSLPAEPVNRLN